MSVGKRETDVKRHHRKLESGKTVPVKQHTRKLDPLNNQYPKSNPETIEQKELFVPGMKQEEEFGIKYRLKKEVSGDVTEWNKEIDKANSEDRLVQIRHMNNKHYLYIAEKGSLSKPKYDPEKLDEIKVNGKWYGVIPGSIRKERAKVLVKGKETVVYDKIDSSGEFRFSKKPSP